MAAYVGRIGSALSATGGTAIVVTVGASGVGAGHSILVGLMVNNVTLAGVISCADSKGNVYTKDVDQNDGGTTTTDRVLVFSSHNVTALVSGDLITVTSISNAEYVMSADEFSGLATSAVLDKSSSNQAKGDAFTSNATATTTQADELLYGIVGVQSGSTPTFTIASGWQNLVTLSPSAGDLLRSAWQETNATAAYAAVGTGVGAGQQWLCGIATYIAVASVGVSKPRPIVASGAVVRASRW